MSNTLYHALDSFGHPRDPGISSRRDFPSVDFAARFFRAVEYVRLSPHAQLGSLYLVPFVGTFPYTGEFRLVFELDRLPTRTPQSRIIHAHPSGIPGLFKFPDALSNYLQSLNVIPDWYVACLREHFMPTWYPDHSNFGVHRNKIELLPFYEFPLTLFEHPPFASVLEDLGGLYY